MTLKNIWSTIKGKKATCSFLLILTSSCPLIISATRDFIGVYDQHIVPLTERGEGLNARTYFDDAASRRDNTGYFEETFYSIESFDVEISH